MVIKEAVIKVLDDWFAFFNEEESSLEEKDLSECYFVDAVLEYGIPFKVYEHDDQPPTYSSLEDKCS
jgi:hypothetical protein